MLTLESHRKNSSILNENESRYERGRNQLTLPSEVKIGEQIQNVRSDIIDNCLDSPDV